MTLSSPLGRFWRSRLVFPVLALALCLDQASAQQGRPPLAPTDVDAIARLVMMEDRRTFDGATLAELLKAGHPEVRRRAAQTLGRLADLRGVSLLQYLPADTDSAVTATRVWGVGQLREPASIRWLDSVLLAPTSLPTVRAEAAIALGKLKIAPAGEVLRRFLTSPKVDTVAGAARGEAILALGRVSPRADLEFLYPLSESLDEELRWRAAWTLVRTKDPGAVPTLYTQSGDPSGLVRSWAVRGLARGPVDSAIRRLGGGKAYLQTWPNLGRFRDVSIFETDSSHYRALVLERLVRAVSDSDRRVSTEALKALATYGDSVAFAILKQSAQSPDPWQAVSATEGLVSLKTPRSTAALVELAGATHPCAIRVVALQGLQGAQALELNTALAIGMATDTLRYCRGIALNLINRDASSRTSGTAAHAAMVRFGQDTDDIIRYTALQTLWVPRDAGLDRAARLALRAEAFRSADPIIRGAAFRSMAAAFDSTDVPMLLAAYDREQQSANPVAAAALVAILGNTLLQDRLGNPAPRFVERFSPPANAAARREIERGAGGFIRERWNAMSSLQRELPEYRAIVSRWIVPDYLGKPRPLTEWVTPRGTMTIELFAGDAPLAMEELARLTNQGALNGTQFTRVVADFVNQQETIRGAVTQRDEVNRRGLTRSNLAWATAGLDTGAPGYTLGHTPQPHNEGDFTSLGRVIKGLEVMDRIQLGDRVITAKLLPGSGGQGGGR